MKSPLRNIIFILSILVIIISLNSQVILSKGVHGYLNIPDETEEIIPEENIDDNLEELNLEEEIVEESNTEEDVEESQTQEEIVEEELEEFYVNIDNIDENILENIETEIIEEVVNETINETDIIINDTEQEVNETEINDTQVNETIQFNETIEEELVEEVIEEEKESFLTLRINKLEYKVGETVSIYVDAPPNSDINLLVSNQQYQYAYFYSDEIYPSTFRFPLTDVEGEYKVTAVLYMSDEKETKEITFNVIPNIEADEFEVNIDAPNEIKVGETIYFKSIVWGANNPELEWYFEDDGSTQTAKTAKHVFESAGIYVVKLIAKADDKTASDSLIIHVSPNKNKFIVQVKDNKNKPISDAAVTIANQTETTNKQGRAEVMLPKGEYELHIEKEGYLPYDCEEEIKNYKLSIINLEDSININTKVSKLRNQIVDEVKVLDQDGNLIENIDYENRILELLLDTDGIKVAIKDFRSIDANWDNIEKIKISNEDSKLTKEIDNLGFIPKSVISIQDLDQFIEEYYGLVTFDITGLEFNSVLYCNDYYECSKVNGCITGIGKEACYSIKNNELTVYVPHFSSIILALDNRTATINILSPAETETTGENIYLNFTINETVTASYSLDGKSIIDLGENTAFSTLLEGTLENNILDNSKHNITIEITDEFNNTNSTLYYFTVNDTFPPIIEILHDGVDIDNKITNSENNTQEIIINSDEYSIVSYKLNSDSYIDIILNESNSANILITPINSSNNITVNASDIHNNNAFMQFSFDFIHNTSSCSDGIKNGDETGIDCGGSCNECIPFNVTLDKEVYNTTDNVKTTVISRADSEVNLTVFLDSEIIYNEFITSYSPGYPIYVITTIENTDEEGTYTVEAKMKYLQETETITKTFEVVEPSQSNPLQITINSNATEILAGEEIKFNATITGSTGSIDYKWDFNNDNTIDSTSSTPTYKFETEGTFKVNLTIEDDSWTKEATKTITVKKYYNVSVTVKHNETNEVLSNAEVELHSQIKNTSSSGKVSFKIEQGEYSLTVRKTDFASESRSVDIDSNKAYTVTLKEKDRTAPAIEIISPKKNDVINDDKTTLRYKAYDDTRMTCKIFINSFDDWWNLEKIHYNVESSFEQTHSLENLENKEYKWKIECTDGQSNIGSSDSISFTIDNGATTTDTEETETTEFDTETEDLVAQIELIMEDLDSLGTLEKEAANLMDLRNKLEKAKTNIRRANRDMHNLKWRKANETDQAKQEIEQRIEDIKKDTPVKIKVIDTNEFVKYPTKEDIENLTITILEFDNIRLKNKDKKKIINAINDLQSAVTITTKFRVVEIEYLSGGQGTITIIQKEVKSKEDTANYNLVESIPKTIAQDTDEMEILFQTEIINPDPILRIELDKTEDIVYYVKKRVSALEIQDTNSILIPKQLDEGMGKVTGFSIFGDLGSKFVEQSGKRLVIEIIIIIILLLTYLVYSVEGFHNVKFLFTNKEDFKRLKEVKDLMEEAGLHIKNSKYDEAKSAYNKIKTSFKALPAELRKNVLEKIKDTRNKIDTYYINDQTAQALAFIKNKESEKAVPIYEEIKTIYKNISPAYKAAVIAKCKEIYKSLNEAK